MKPEILLVLHTLEIGINREFSTTLLCDNLGVCNESALSVIAQCLPLSSVHPWWWS